MRKVAYLGLSLMLFALAAPAFAQDIKDQAEYNAYIAVYNEKDLAKKAAGAEKFIADYPKTTAITQAYMIMLLSNAQIPKWDKALDTSDKQAQIVPTGLSPEDKMRVLQIGMTAAEQLKNIPKLNDYAEKVLAVDPKNVGALVTLSNLLAGSFPTDDTKKDAHFTKTLEITRRALAAGKPNAQVTDTQWNPVLLQLRHTVALVLLNQKKYADSIAESKVALGIDKKDGYSWYLIGLALSPGLNDAVKKYTDAIAKYNDNRDKDQITRDELKSLSDGAETAATAKKDEIINAFARSVAAGGPPEARKQLQALFKGTADELNELVADKKTEMDGN